MSPLDVGTVLLGYSLSAFVSALVLAALWRQHRRHFAGLGFWLAAFVLQFAGILLVAVRNRIPDLLSMVVGNGCVVGGAVLLYYGLERFVDRRGRPWLPWLVLAVYLAVQTYFALIQPSLIVRAINLSLALAALSALCAWLLLRRTGARLRPVTRLAGVVLAAFSVVSLAGAAAVLIWPYEGDFLLGGLTQAAPLLVYQTLYIGLAFSLCLMVPGRLEGDVQRLNAELEQRVAARTAALRESEERHRLISGLMSDYVYGARLAADGLGPMDWVEGALEQITGYSLDEIYALPGRFASLVFTEDFERLLPLQAALRTGEPVEVEYRIHTRSGETRWLRDHLRPMAGGDGQEVPVVGAVQDITASKQAETALRESEARYHGLFDNSSSVMLLVDPATGEIVDANPAAAGFYGWPVAELKAKNVREINTLPPDQVLAGMAEARAERRKLFFFTHRLANGELHPVEVYTGPLVLNGRTLLFSVIHDITDRVRSERERQQAEDKLRETKQLYEGIFQLSPALIVVSTEEEGRFLAANAASERIVGYRPEEIVGRTSAELDVWASPGERERTVRRLQAEGSLHNVVFHPRRRSGEEFPALLSMARAEVGGQKCIISLVTDITERARSEQERQQAEEALRESQARLSFALEKSGTGGWELDLADHSVIRTPEHDRIFGYPELLPRWTYEMFLAHVLPEDRAEVDRRFQEAAAKQITWSFKCRIRRPDGEMRWISAVGGHPGEADGAPRRMIGILQDITERKQAEEALLQVSERLELVQKAARVGTWDWDLITGHIIWSPLMFDLFGLDPQTQPASFESWRVALHPQDREAAEARIAAALAERRPLSNEYRIIRPSDGRLRWISALGEGIYDPLGIPLRMIGICLDISAAKQAEAALRESEERFRTVADFTHDWEYWLGADGELLYCSPSCERITGYSAEEYRNNPGLILSIVHPEDRGLLESYMRAGSLRDEVCNCDVRITTRPGPERWLNHVCQPVYGAEGRWLGRRASNRDITARKRTEAALHESEERYRRLFQEAVLGIFQTTLDGKVLAVNPAFARMFGYDSPEDVLASLPSAAEVFANPARRAEIIRLQREQPELTEFENLYRRKDGSTFTGRLHLGGVIDTAGHLQYFEGFIQDITARKQAEEALRLSEARYHALADENARLLEQSRADARTKATLLQEVNHRVKNNLAAIVGLLFLELRHRPAGVSEDYLRLVEGLTSRVQSLATVHSLLSAGAWGPLPLTALAEQVLRATLALVPPRRQVQMQVESSEVLLSPKQANALGLVINELAANALNHSGRVNEPLALWVRIRSAGDEVSLAVCDNGAGFPAEVLEGEARGVGLYLARTLIESDLLGSLRLYNERGAVAEVRFSVAADE